MVYGKCTTLFLICQKNNWQLTTGKVLCAFWGLEHKAIITNHQLPIRNNCQLSIAQLFSGRSLRTTLRSAFRDSRAESWSRWNAGLPVRRLPTYTVFRIPAW